MGPRLRGDDAEFQKPHPDRLTPVDPPHKGEGEDYPRRNASYPNPRNSRRSTLPVAVIGRESANWMWRGYSCAASCTLTNS